MNINLIMEDEELRELIKTSEKWQRLLDSLPDNDNTHKVYLSKIYTKKSKQDVLDRLETLVEDN